MHARVVCLGKIRGLALVLCLLAAANVVSGQVSEIKAASSSASSRAPERRDGGNGIMFDILFNVVFGEIIQAQQQKLERRHEIPGLISFEALIQTAVQPSSYYIVQPRARLNWGLFSTDFRFNYLVEEELGRTQHLRTNDWQVLQLNLVTTRDITFRLGAGMLHEAFGEQKVYGEWTAGLRIQPHLSRLGGTAEYRSSEARDEISGFAQWKILDQGISHAFLTGGAVYQRYYGRIPVWGMQGGMLVRFY